VEEEATAGGQDWWQFLAVELKQHIWSHLDAKDIIMATTVSSGWRNILLADQHQPWATIFQRFLPPAPNIRSLCGHVLVSLLVFFRCLGGPQKGADSPMETWYKYLIRLSFKGGRPL